jgi:hypothetical protein
VRSRRSAGNDPEGTRTTAVTPGLMARAAIACLTAGFGLLTIADADWAHAVGIVCLLAFILLAFPAITFTAIRELPSELAVCDGIVPRGIRLAAA